MPIHEDLIPEFENVFWRHSAHVIYIAPIRKGAAKMAKRVPETVLPEGYNGKILLVSIGGPGVKECVILRSGDDWHREILRNTEVEMQDYGISSAHLQEL